MPASWHQGSYAQLEDALRQLRRDYPLEYWHLNHRYILRTTRVTTKVVEVRTPKGTLRTPTPTVEYVEHPDVRDSVVNRGIQLLSHLTQGDVWLPRDVYEATK